MTRGAARILVLFLLLSSPVFAGEAYSFFAAAERPEASGALRAIARSSLKACVLHEKPSSRPKGEPAILGKPSGVFVTLVKSGRPRGCMGTLTPATDSLASELERAAFLAARGDGRVKSVTPGELPEIEILISIPGPLRRVNGLAELAPGRLGLLVRSGSKSALLLPGEARTAEWQLQECLRKAGISKRERFSLYVFPTVVIGPDKNTLRGKTRRRL